MTPPSHESREEAAKLLPLTPAVFHIALALIRGPCHGYGLMQETAAMTGGAVQLGPGTLYRSLQRMDRDGLIEETPVGLENEPDERRRYYRLTRFGELVARLEAQRLEHLVRTASSRGLLAPGGSCAARLGDSG